jgi:addiction module HigA family antidote
MFLFLTFVVKNVKMLPEIDKVKGIHPGAILAHEIKKRNLKNGQFALDIHEYPQIISSVTKEKRGVTPGLSIKLGEAFGSEPSYFLVLQAYYEIEKEKTLRRLSNQERPDFSKLRRILFWDTNPDTIDWTKNRNAVIERVFERGNQVEKTEITMFYGNEAIRNSIETNAYISEDAKSNALDFLGIAS